MSDINIRNLTVKYGEKLIFENFNIDFTENKVNVVLGGSGVGKTTLLNVLAGVKEYTGEINGKVGGTSYIFQKDRLIPTISVYKNLDLVLRAVLKDKNERKKAIYEMLDLLEITEQAHKLPTAISGGQAQRAAMARAFLFPADVLLMDEPFKALDTALKSRLLGQFALLNERKPRTVVFVTHAIDECLLSADRYAVLADSPAVLKSEGEITVPKNERNLKLPDLDSVRLKLLDALL